jgi:hypothetical protein
MFCEFVPVDRSPVRLDRRQSRGWDASPGGDVGAKCGRFGVGGAELQREIDLRFRSGEVATTQQGDGDVVVIVGIFGVGSGGALKQGSCIVALAAGGNALVVHDLG